MTDPRILIVEDETALTAVVRDYLVAAGMGVDILSEGTDAVPTAREGRPDLAIAAQALGITEDDLRAVLPPRRGNDAWPRMTNAPTETRPTKMTTTRSATPLGRRQVLARTNGLDLSIASSDPAAGIVHDPSDRFSKTYMNALFRHGFDRGARRRLWTIG
ncbi:response regulator [Tropicibacter oceani]|uniref:Response regulatory domain-containing protein n=1 Tax=Tropicibacter oceani TaxID=3058420 RepID=A0ABY8QHJ1_9RHOB|nr:hypothetical protein [Tropicibacter oceani]WGW04121.1 hypothetical protein QF118_00860 [Tropicibacter oceani]